MALPDFKLHLKGYVGDWDFDADYVDYVIRNHKGGPLYVLIDSLGGQLDTALSISAAFARHGDVHVHYSGMNASAATIAGMSAKEITIDSNALWLVHNSSYLLDVYKQANSADMSNVIEILQKKIKDLDTFDASIAETYAKRCKKTPKELADLMSEEKWLSAHEALEWGFVDAVVETDGKKIMPAESVVCAMREAGLPIPSQCRHQSFLDRVAETVSNVLSSCGIKKNDSIKSENMEMENQEVAPVVENTAETAPREPEAVMENNSTDNESHQDSSNEDGSDVEALRRELAETKARLQELEKSPAEDTKSVVNADGGQKAGSAVSFVSDIASARRLMESVGF